MDEITERAFETYCLNVGRLFCEWVTERDMSADEVADESRNLVAHRDQLEIALLACQSPIEQLLLAGLAFVTDHWGNLITVGPPEGADGLFLEGQGAVGKHRADFLVTARYGTWSRQLAIECDGHDFHEKTKEQATRDKKRDRAFVAAGVQIVRFTGSEIYRDPAAAVAECSGLIGDMNLDVFGLFVRKGQPPVPFDGTGFRARLQGQDNA